ncbi:MAG: ATP-binding protein [Kangiellaceae bacterium]|nr:ATP-binding protein [Kangiellaceae bacterium]MCW9016399.1 ATP-binding protein [Kangiellaceae bacterium]
MVFSLFAVTTLLRLGLIFISLLALVFVLQLEGYYAVTLLLSLTTLALAGEFLHKLNKSHLEMIRFVDSIKNSDFSQKFTSHKTSKELEPLLQSFESAMQKLRMKRAERELDLNYLTSIVEHIPLPLISIKTSGKIILHNNAARQFFAASRVENAEHLDAFGDTFKTALLAVMPGKSQLADYHFDGVKRRLTISASELIIDGENEKLISMQDIQSELDTAQLYAWQDLVRVLTHEIMNSITPVASLAKTASELVEHAKNGVESNSNDIDIHDDLDDIKKATDTVASRSESLNQFVQNYRSLTLMPTPEKKIIKVSDLFVKVTNLVTPNFNDNSIEFSSSITPPSLELNADPDLIEQILINLIKNSEQAFNESSKSTALPSIALNARLNKNGHVVIEVKDNGPGIPDDIAKEVFVPFYTTKAKGSGVGLAFTRQTMIAHGGTITLDNSRADETKFILVF